MKHEIHQMNSGEKFNLSQEQQRVVDAALGGRSLFLSGGAGTGKSQTLRAIIDHLRKKRFPGSKGRVAVVAPTGAAALQTGGLTIHSWAGLGIMSKKDIPGIDYDKLYKTVWQVANVLVIDEISMVTDWMMYLLDQIARHARNKKDLPFGGLQIILCGDFLQLPPIDGELAFKSSAWRELNPECYCLQYVFRQGEDPEFAQLLGQIRVGNDLVLPLLLQTSSVEHETGILPTNLYSTRAMVDQDNLMHLEKLPGRIFQFVAEDSGDPKLFQSGKVQSWTNAPDRLQLKVGAQVVLLRNMDLPNGLANGSRGVVIGFEEGSLHPVVRFMSGKSRVINKFVWTSKKKLATRCQYPLDLAWCLTIHKAQGMSLDTVHVDLSNAFEAGQAYVAISRCRTRKGLVISNLTKSAIRANKDALEFYASLQEAPKLKKIKV